MPKMTILGKKDDFGQRPSKAHFWNLYQNNRNQKLYRLKVEVAGNGWQPISKLGLTKREKSVKLRKTEFIDI